jgi:hypothetical protein
MYNHRTEKTRVDVVDLDPYGTAAPFIDGAVQCVNDGGKSTKMCASHRGLILTLHRTPMRHMHRLVSSGDNKLS